METQRNNPILFASDLTPEMKQVFHYAAIQALTQKTEIIILHVMEKNPSAENQISMWFGKDKYQDLKTQHRQKAQSKLIGKNLEMHRIRQAIEGFFEEHEHPSLIKNTFVKVGRSISNEIISTALEEDCCMIVIGISQQGLISSAMSDHVVRKILKRSKVPVMVVPVAER